MRSSGSFHFCLSFLSFLYFCCQVSLVQSQNGPSPFDSPAFDFTVDLADNQSKFTNVMSKHNIEVSAYYLLQDSVGLIWVGTPEGLFKYDGNQFTRYTYDPLDTNSIIGSTVYSFCEGKGGIIWIGTDKGLTRFDRNKGQFTRYVHDPKDSSSLSHNFVGRVLEDHSGVLWVGTVGGGLNRLDPGSSEFVKYKHDPEDSLSLLNDEVRVLLEDHKGRLWVGNNRGGGVHRLDRKTGQFTRFPVGKNGMSSGWIFDMAEDQKGNVWVATVYGLNKIDGKTDKITQYIFPRSDNYSSTMFISIDISSEGLIWLGTGNNGSGLLCFNPENGDLKRFVYDQDNPNSLSDNVVMSILEDSEKNLWLGTSQGLDKMKIGLTSFHFINREEDRPGALSNNYVTSIYEDPDSNLWVGTYRKGLNRWNLREEPVNFHNFRYERGIRNGIGSNIVGYISGDQEGNLWITYRTNITAGDLTQWNSTSSQFINYQLPIGRDRVFHFLETRNGDFWVGALYGLNKFNPDSGQFTLYPVQQDTFCQNSSRLSPILCNGVTTILEDHQGTIWVGTTQTGLARFDKKTGEFEYFGIDPENPKNVKAESIHYLHEDQNKRLWIGTGNEALYLFDREKETFQHYGNEQGLPARNIYSILEDDRGILWLGTSQGLFRFDPESDFFIQYDKSDGIPSMEFNIKAAHKSKNSGKFYFGTTHGLVSFHPDNMKVNSYKPPVIIKSLRRFNAEDPEGEGTLVQGISLKKSIRLSYKDDLLIFDLASLSFQSPGKNKYAYRLEGAEDRWINLGTNHTLMLSNLAPGNYTLYLKGSNGDGVWNEEGASLNIRITPPWYWAWWSKSLYALMVLAGLYLLYRIQLNRRLIAAEAHRLRELDEVKTQLYTNITHEFRTPLTIILGMVDKMKDNPKQWFSEGISMIKRNGHQLLHLINQILDLRKLESGRMSLNPVQADILSYLKYHLEAFHTYAEERDIRLHFISEVEELQMDFAPKELQHIMNNLLSNAIKYNKEGGNVYVSIAKTTGETKREAAAPLGGWGAEPASHFLSIKVKDTGIGIPENQLPHIFDRFYQVDSPEHRNLAKAGEGAGIGLALTKELVKLMDGRISVKSKQGEGTTFEILLPIRQSQAFVPAGELGVTEHYSKLSASPLTEVEAVISLAARPQVLIVEDNKDVVYYLQSCLQAEYQLEVAYDGAEGIEKALEQVPDLIISDVMMPEKDGFELCAELKQDLRTSHIPIILLTAKGDLDSRLEGLEQGADAYLAKPFEEQELLVSMDQMIKLRKRLQEKYGDPLLKVDQVKMM